MFAAISGLLAFIIPTILPGVDAAACSRNYTIKANDTCDQISDKNSVPTYQLSIVNTGVIDVNCTNLFVGDTICLAVKGEDCNDTWTIDTGESCETIAAECEITTELLLSNNPNINADCSNIYEGEVLCTSDKKFTFHPPSAPSSSTTSSSSTTTTTTRISTRTTSTRTSSTRTVVPRPTPSDPPEEEDP